MSTLEDKILGEKLQNYCSSSEDEGGDDEDSRSGDEEGDMSKPSTAYSEPAPVNNWTGTASNTGPKGVLEDWRKFKQLEAENREELTKERIALAKKLTMSVQTLREEDEAKEEDELEDELNELIEEGFLMKYQQQRMQELMAQLQKTPKFGTVITLKSQSDFLTAIDKEDTKVTVVVHIYNANNQACMIMDTCINILANDYPAIKFCRIPADITTLTENFRRNALPSLLAYKGGQIIGNFIQLASELGDDFFASDVEKLLIEYGILPEN